MTEPKLESGLALRLIVQAWALGLFFPFRATAAEVVVAAPTLKQVGQALARFEWINPGFERTYLGNHVYFHEVVGPDDHQGHALLWWAGGHAHVLHVELEGTAQSPTPTWMQANPETKVYRAAYYQKNRRRIDSRSKAYRKRNRAKENARKQLRAKEHPEKISRQNARCYQRHREERLEQFRNYYQAHKEEIRARRRLRYEKSKQLLKARKTRK